VTFLFTDEYHHRLDRGGLLCEWQMVTSPLGGPVTHPSAGRGHGTHRRKWNSNNLVRTCIFFIFLFFSSHILLAGFKMSTKVAPCVMHTSQKRWHFSATMNSARNVATDYCRITGVLCAGKKFLLLYFRHGFIIFFPRL